MRKLIFLLIIFYGFVAYSATCPEFIEDQLKMSLTFTVNQSQPIELLYPNGKLKLDPSIPAFKRGVMGAALTRNLNSLFVFDDTSVVVLSRNDRGRYRFDKAVWNLAHLLKGDANGSWIYKVLPSNDGKSFWVRYLIRDRDDPLGFSKAAHVRFKQSSIVISKSTIDMTDSE